MANQYYDLRLGYLVETPGLDDPLTDWEVKAGDGEEVVLQFGRSAADSGPTSIASAPSWTAENLDGTATIHIGIKEAGDYYDGDLLAGASTFTHDAGEKTYTFELDLATTEINTALSRDDADDTNDTASIEAHYEVTFKSPSTAAPRSSVKPVTVTIYHDILSTLEASPSNANDPDLYALTADTVVFHDQISSQTGGTSADFDSLTTTTLSAGEAHAFFDDDSSGAFRVYELVAGTDAESAPDTIRPDDYAASTNEKVWKLRNGSTSNGVGILWRWEVASSAVTGTLADTEDFAPAAFTCSSVYAYIEDTSSPALQLEKDGSQVGSGFTLNNAIDSSTKNDGSEALTTTFSQGDKVGLNLTDDDTSGSGTSAKIVAYLLGTFD